MTTDPALPTRLCFFGDGRHLLDCFELVRQAGSVGPGNTFAGMRLGAAPADGDGSPADEARELGIDWNEDVAALLRDAASGLLVLVSDAAALPCPLPAGWRVLAPPEARLLFTLTARAAAVSACRPDMARARRLLATLLDNMDDEIALLAPDGTVLDANASLARRLEKSREALVGLPGARAFPDFPDMDTAGEEGGPSIHAALAAGRKVSRETSRVDRRGRLRYFRSTFYPVCGPHGHPDHMAVLRRDITQDIFLERRLQKSERLAAIGELSMFISHEIRNPLFAIAGFANALVRAKDLGEASREKASIILSESRRLDGILKDIINFSRPTASKPGEVDLADVARRTTALMRHALEGQGVTVALDLSPDAPVARGDPETLTQCLVNCLKNAMEAMPEGGHVTVATRLDQGRARLSVTDDGPGISPDILSRVFNPFFTTRDKRAGLGLAMTKKILEDLGGTVELESVPGKGTTVTLSLPPFLDLSPEEV